MVKHDGKGFQGFFLPVCGYRPAAAGQPFDAVLLTVGFELQGIAQGFCRVSAGRVVPCPLPATIVFATDDLHAADGFAKAGCRCVKVNDFDASQPPKGLLAFKAMTEVWQGEFVHFVAQGKVGGVIGGRERVVVKAHAF